MAQKIDSFELLEAQDGSLMLTLPLLPVTSDKTSVFLSVENKTLFFVLDGLDEQFYMSPFPMKLLDKIKELDTLLVSEFSDTGLARAHESEVKLLD